MFMLEMPVYWNAYFWAPEVKVWAAEIAPVTVDAVQLLGNGE